MGAVPGQPPVTDLNAPTHAQFWADAAAGKYKASDLKTVRTLGMVNLATFLKAVAAPEFGAALKIAAEA